MYVIVHRVSIGQEGCSERVDRGIVEIFVIVFIVTVTVIVIIVMLTNSNGDNSNNNNREDPRGMRHDPRKYIRSPLQDSRLFGPSPWKVLAATYEQMGS